MNFLIIEDEPLVAKDLEKMVRSLDPAIRILDVLPSVAEATRWFTQHPAPDLIFSDIQLSDGVSFDIFKSVNADCPIIFTTAYDEYALRAFRLNSIGYLLKPVDFNELQQVYQRFLKYNSSENTNTFKHEFQLFLENLGQKKKYKDRFIVHMGNAFVPVTGDQVICFKRDSMIFLVNDTGEQLITDYHSLEELEELLDPRQYYRANRQYIVNKDYIESYRVHYTGKLEIKSCHLEKEEITVSKEKAAEFKKWFDS